MKCKNCGKEIAKKSKVCPHCGDKAEQSKIKAVIISVVVALIVVMVGSMVLGMVSCSNKEDPIETSLELGYKYLEEGRYEEAILEFDKVLKIDEKNTDAIIGTADAYIGLGEFNTAASFMEECIGRDKENTELYNKLVDMYTNNGDYENANRIIELARENGCYFDEEPSEAVEEMATEMVTEAEPDYDSILEGDFSLVAGIYKYPDGNTFELLPSGLSPDEEEANRNAGPDDTTCVVEDIEKLPDGTYTWGIGEYWHGECMGGAQCIIYPVGVEVIAYDGRVLDTDTSKIRYWCGQDVVAYEEYIAHMQ